MTHAELLALLLPPGSYDPSGATIASELAAEGNALDQAMGDGLATMGGITPFGREDLLPDWERVYGLADDAVRRTLAERLAALLQRINELGGLSREYFLFAALNLGFSISITEFKPFRVGSSHVGDPLYGDDWMFTWRVLSSESTTVSFKIGDTVVEGTLGNEFLESLLRLLAPAHTVLQFSYGGDPSLMVDEDGEGFFLDEDNDYLDFS